MKEDVRFFCLPTGDLPIRGEQCALTERLAQRTWGHSCSPWDVGPGSPGTALWVLVIIIYHTPDRDRCGTGGGSRATAAPGLRLSHPARPGSGERGERPVSRGREAAAGKSCPGDVIGPVTREGRSLRLLP